jgi:hypothetical protein
MEQLSGPRQLDKTTLARELSNALSASQFSSRDTRAGEGSFSRHRPL